jgi:hypothetical protein
MKRPWGRTVLGTKQSLDKTSLATLRQYVPIFRDGLSVPDNKTSLTHKKRAFRFLTHFLLYTFRRPRWQHFDNILYAARSVAGTFQPGTLRPRTLRPGAFCQGTKVYILRLGTKVKSNKKKLKYRIASALIFFHNSYRTIFLHGGWPKNLSNFFGKN